MPAFDVAFTRWRSELRSSRARKFKIAHGLANVAESRMRLLDGKLRVSKKADLFLSFGLVSADP